MLLMNICWNEKIPGCLGCIGGYTTLSYGVYYIPLYKESLLNSPVGGFLFGFILEVFKPLCICIFFDKYNDNHRRVEGFR